MGDIQMRILPAICATIAVLGLTACTYVERERPAPVVVQPAPNAAVPQYVPPATTVRPGY
jgi:hypothetical protein